MDQDSSFPLTLSYNRLFEIKLTVIFSTNIPIAIKDIFLYSSFTVELKISYCIYKVNVDKFL